MGALKHAESIAGRIFTDLIERVAAKGEEANLHKSLLENLTEDLMTVLFLPEYPAAEPMLFVLVQLLVFFSHLKFYFSSLLFCSSRRAGFRTRR